MIKKISFAIFLVLILVFCTCAIQAGDINADDIGLDNVTDIQIADNSQLGDETDIGDGYSLLKESAKNHTKLTSASSSIYYNGNYKVTLTDSNANATMVNKTVYLSINDVAYSATTDSKGIASFNLKLNPGSYLATAYFTGDDDFEPSSDLSSQLKILPTVKANDVTKYYKGSKSYQATYLDSQGNPLKNRKVTITVNGKKYTKQTNNKGVASFSINFKPGTYNVAASNPSNGYKLTTSFKILSTVTSSNIKKVKGDSKRFVAKFFKSNGKALSKKQVKIKISGKVRKYKTNSKGEVRMSFNQYKKGTYKVVSYSPDGLSKTSTVQVYNIATTRLNTGYYTFLPNDTKAVKISFTTNLGDNSKAGKLIRISVEGRIYSQKTDKNGEINFKLPYLAPGIYTFDCEFEGNKFFKSAYAYRLLTILDTSDTRLTLESTTSFGDHTGAPLRVAYSAGDVPLIRKTVSFSVNGKTYAATTDDAGVASMPIYLDAGNYTVNYKTSGDSKVCGTSGSCQIEVFKRINTQITCNFAKSYKDSSQTFKARLTGLNGSPMAYEDVELIIGAETYYGMTNANGYVSFKTEVPFGKYKATIRFSGNNEYAPSSVSKSINVELSKFAKGLNEKKASASSSYLKATKNCQANNAKIKSLVKSLTKGMTESVDKAKAIFNYVRENIAYGYYYDTHKGAVGTLTSKIGNCVDQSHLLVAMYRAAGLKARYVHGKCKFYDDGLYYGHVWTQVLIDNTWVCGDAISYSNELGRVDAWNTNNFKLRNYYLALPF